VRLGSDRLKVSVRDPVNLNEIAGSATGRAGVIWTLREGADLNANLVRFEGGRGVGEHVNDEVDVLVVGISGSGTVSVDGEAYPVSNGTVVLVPRGAARSTRAASEGFAYLSLHRRRGPLQIGV
jgi:quercetin dioxygenase-like cupin family protein